MRPNARALERQKAIAFWADYAPPPSSRITTKDVLSVVERETCIPGRAIMGVGRSRAEVRARQIFMYAARAITGRSFPGIGATCRRDHSTVMYGVRKVAQAREKFEPELSRVLAVFGVRP